MTKKSNDVVIISALRTPIGKFKGKLAKLQSYELGAATIKAVIKDAKIDKNLIDEIILGQVLTTKTGQNPARQAAIKSGIPYEKTSYIINQVCGSGLRSIAAAYNSILVKDSKIIIAGGQESMSNCDDETILKDGLIDAFNNYHMGITAENVADKWGISRKDQDKFAVESQTKTQEALKNKKFKEEIISDFDFIDEHPRQNVSLETLSTLKPAFKKDGTVTAGNSSGVNDGAAAIIVTSREVAEKKGFNVLGKISSWATCGVDPALMGSGPIPASKKALQKASWNIEDLDLIETNEAFAAQSIAVVKDLKIPKEKVNVNGGAIALGHPIGASGSRIVVTLIHEMIKRDVKKGLATLCIGGGMGIAMCLERD